MKYIYILIIVIIILVLFYIFTPYINIEKFSESEFLFNRYPLVFRDQESKEELGTFPTTLTPEQNIYELTYIDIKKGEKGDRGPEGEVGPPAECQGDVNISSITSEGNLDIDVNNLDIRENGSINFNNKICFSSGKCIDDDFINKVNDINTDAAPALVTCQNERAILNNELNVQTQLREKCDSDLHTTCQDKQDITTSANDLIKTIEDYDLLTQHLQDKISKAIVEINNNWVKKGNADFDDLKPDVKQQYAPKFNFPLIKFVSEKDPNTVISTYPDPVNDPTLHQQVSQLGNEIVITIPQGEPGNPGPSGPAGPQGPSGDRGRECFTNYEKFTDISLTNIGGPFIRFINRDTGEIQATIPKNFPSEKEIQDSDINVIDIPLYPDPDLKGYPGPSGRGGGLGNKGPPGTCCPPPPPRPPPPSPPNSYRRSGSSGSSGSTDQNVPTQVSGRPQYCHSGSCKSCRLAHKNELSNGISGDPVWWGIYSIKGPSYYSSACGRNSDGWKKDSPYGYGGRVQTDVHHGCFGNGRWRNHRIVVC